MLPSRHQPGTKCASPNAKSFSLCFFCSSFEMAKVVNGHRWQIIYYVLLLVINLRTIKLTKKLPTQTHTAHIHNFLCVRMRQRRANINRKIILIRKWWKCAFPFSGGWDTVQLGVTLLLLRFLLYYSCSQREWNGIMDEPSWWQCDKRINCYLLFRPQFAVKNTCQHMPHKKHIFLNQILIAELIARSVQHVMNASTASSNNIIPICMNRICARSRSFVLGKQSITTCRPQLCCQIELN